MGLESIPYLVRFYCAVIIGLPLSNLLVNGLHLNSSFQITAGLLFFVVMGCIDVLVYLFSSNKRLGRKDIVMDVISDALVLPRLYKAWVRERGLLIPWEDRDNVLRSANIAFLGGVGLGVLSFSMFALLSVYYYFNAPYIAGHVPIPDAYAFRVGDFVRKILSHNLIILADVILGGFTGMLLTLRVLYVNGLSVSIMTSLVLSGYGNTVLPQGLLELFALSTSTGTSALVFFALWSSFAWKYKDKDIYIGLLLRLLLRIGVSAALSIFMILIAANVEYSNILFLLGKVAEPPAWYVLVYVGDGLLITSSLLTLFDTFVFERLHASWLYDRFFFPFLFTFAVLNGPAPFDSTTKLIVLGSFAVSLFVLTRHTVQSLLTYLLRPRRVLDFELSILQGTSMNPTIFEGDIVLISKKVPEKLKPGMVLDVRIPARYMSRARNFVHRLVWTDKRTIQTKGDNLKRLDPKIPLRNVEGIVLALLRWDGKSLQVEPLVDGPLDVPPQAFQVADELVRLYQSVKSKSRFLGLYLPLLIAALSSSPLVIIME